jgi:hypothetical protein
MTDNDKFFEIVGGETVDDTILRLYEMASDEGLQEVLLRCISIENQLLTNIQLRQDERVELLKALTDYRIALYEVATEMAQKYNVKPENIHDGLAICRVELTKKIMNFRGSDD